MSATVSGGASPTGTDSPTPDDSTNSGALPAVAGVAAVTATPTPCTSSTSSTPTRGSAKLTLTASSGSIGYQAKFTVTARFGVPDPGAQVSIWSQTVGSTTGKLVKRGPVEGSNGKGDLAVTVVHTESTTFTAFFRGDARYAPATVTTTVNVAARVTQSLAGYYKSERYAGTEYRVYHRTATLKDTAAVAPNKHGECVEFALQIYFQGKWYNDLPSGETTTRCGALSKSSTVLGDFGLKSAAGYRYRIRALFIHAKSDRVNLSSDSSWGYFRVTT